MKRLQTLPLAASAALFLASASHAAVVFAEDFESAEDGAWPVVTTDPAAAPDVTAAQSDGNTSGTVPTAYWVGANQGFGGGRRGMVDEDHGDFTEVGAGKQAFAFRYTNSGLTTAEGVIGSLTVGMIYTVSFDVVQDGHNGTTPYNVYLAAFDEGATSRNDVRSDTNQRTVLTSTSGNATEDGLYSTITFAYEYDPVDAALLGKDVGLVFRGATSSAIIDNVVVDVSVIPEPTIALLGSLGLLGLLRRRR